MSHLLYSDGNIPESGETSSHLLESGEVGRIGQEHMKKIREDVAKKWENFGFLDGLSGHVKENIAKLYESQASSLLNETREEEGSDFADIQFPIVRRVISKMQPPSGDTTENKTEDEI
jgi:hypothetical protein